MIDNCKTWRGMLSASFSPVFHNHRIEIKIFEKQKADDNWTLYEFRIESSFIEIYYNVERYIDTYEILK